MRSLHTRSLLIGIPISLLLLWGAVRAVPLAEVTEQIGQVSLQVLSLSLLARLIGFLLAAVRTHLLVRRQKRMDFGVLLRSHLVGFAANNLLPLRTGELVRIDYLARHGELAHSACLPMVATERLLDVAALGLLAVASAPFMSAELPLAPSVYMSLGLAFTGIGLLMAARLRPLRFVAICGRFASLFGTRARTLVEAQSAKVADGLAALPSGADAMLVALLSLAMWVIATLSVAVWLWAFGLELPWYTAPLIIVFLAFGLALPASPGHVGTYHYFVAAALTAVGLDRVRAVSVAVVGHAVAVVPFSLIAVPILVAGFAQRRRLARQTQEARHA
jgi:glycosyltransferase 2 family protein